ncbi:putative NBD/HSP70 family sugar kinase [Clostridium acetobutylicum]|uniref:Transcriptional regulator of NagC/XylR family (Xylose repressor) n=1 Tax=Clostridium acetobutylicum (strain ATCC 824 / DSM 792 / JCM 1419 / IAM 19013 / LMG 5710 / NBRC 13948 / NRRL B-527 / VKM B-1787 / 2291 / W) TaxID=272562 RepID=Q97KI6_CLOAB|nr:MULTISPECIES: ROK family protein [Clostridium]AAK78909.1 Transcriptional regulator of NagC/XylR family (xylose repressor) [Clostridium acetobutylicum ATCC 824]ADZ19984.1 Transcriptional regulator of NagC/XylR family (xylose repressor) [Clostridium acetobutylicum EA 2018]AEI34394.1 NagC/XylR family transcriptional regulator [Clostridium acetobutylicum DSM 1731]AWV80628.1 ROK family protein [Clostridium acetobutylicum]MBC2392818.1 ROK family transcriptional regulator [Clostridium acetobutylic
MSIELDDRSKRIFDLLQKKGAMTKKEILKNIDMKLTTLNRLMRPLEDERLIVEYGIEDSAGGRKPIMYNVNLCGFYIIGIDISREFINIVFTNIKLELFYEDRINLKGILSEKKIADKIINCINKVVGELRLDVLTLFGVGVSVLNVASFKCSGYTKLKSELERELSSRVIIENGANSAALAEYLYGFNRRISNMAYFNCTEIIRSGVVLSGQVLRTINNKEDAFSNMLIINNKNKFDFLGNYVSESSIINNFCSKVKSGRKTIIKKNLREIKLLDLENAINKGDSLSKEVILNSAVIFGIALANYIQVLGLKAIVLGGSLIANSKTFYDVLTKIVFDRIKNHKIKLIREGHFKGNIFSTGAAAVVVEEYLKVSV